MLASVVASADGTGALTCPPLQKEVAVRRLILLMAVMAAAVLVVSGVAYALSVQCDGAGDQDPAPGLCQGTNQNDRITGSQERDEILALGGLDVVTARGGDDFVDGGRGRDDISGGLGGDGLFGGGAPTTSTVAQVRPTLVRHSTPSSAPYVILRPGLTLAPKELKTC
jgi:hypothetical protein